MSDLEILPVRRKTQRQLLDFATAPIGIDSRCISEAVARATGIMRTSNLGIVEQGGIARRKPPESLQERLYNSRAACKLRMAAVAMHIDLDWRNRFFGQIDSLLSVEDWDKEDHPVSDESFTTMIRLLLLITAKRRPGLGATGNGNVIVTWTVGKDRLTIECLPTDEIRWVVVRYLDDDRELASGQTVLSRFLDVLQPYNPKRWFADEGSEVTA